MQLVAQADDLLSVQENAIGSRVSTIFFTIHCFAEKDILRTVPAEEKMQLWGVSAQCVK